MELLKADKIGYEAIRTYGKTHQCVVAMEELAELIQEISKAMRGRPHNLTEEFVDVEIVMEQLKMMFVDEKQQEILRNYKLRRLQQNISFTNSIKNKQSTR